MVDPHGNSAAAAKDVVSDTTASADEDTPAEQKSSQKSTSSAVPYIDVNEVDVNNETALFKAVDNDHQQAAEVLLKMKADANIADFYGRTPLHKVKSVQCCCQ